MADLVLNTGVTIKQLYGNLDQAKLDAIEKASTDGFSEAELEKLEKDGIDISAIKNNSTEKNGKIEGTKTTEAKEKTDADVQTQATRLKNKYCLNLPSYSGDIYSAENPEVQALKKALGDGVIPDLASEGFTKTQIIEIISQAFPNTGIKNGENGKYTVPYGHGEEAQEIFSKFSSQVAAADSPELKAAKEKLANINHQITNNNSQLKSLEYTITTLQSKIEEELTELIKESEEIAENQKEEAANIVSKRLNEYTNSNGDMTYDEFMNNVSGDLDSLAGESNSKLSSVIRKMIDSQRDMATLSGYLSTMSKTIASNESLSKEAKATEQEISDIIKDIENSDCVDEDCQKCDPIGFTNSQVRYDFFIDKDNNNDITNEQEFLGAENGFQELIDKDSNKDGKVTGSELDSKNVKVVVTNADGSQEIKKASDVFSNDDSIDLSSYRAQNTEMSNGNILQGTFNVKFGGKELGTGYQTLDDLNWLDDNYEFTDEAAGIGRFERNDSTAVEALDYSEKYNVFMQKYETLETQEAAVLRKLGLDSDAIKTGITQAATKDGQKKAAAIEEGFKQQAAKNAAEEQKTAEKAEAEKQAEAEAEEKKKLEEEA